jgi:dolichyl-phosphate-mannose-protein mannosyltransferase
MDRANADREHLLLIGIVAAFFACAAFRIGLPPSQIFDEGYYVQAARLLAQGTAVSNREHPMLAKEILALGWWVFGNNLVAYRVLPLLFGSAGLYFAARALWSHTGSAITAIIFAALMATGFLLFGLSRLTLLEPFTFFFAALALHCQARGNSGPAAASIAASVACKWTAAPLALALLAIPLARRDWVAVVKFGAIGAGVYLLTFVPGFFVTENPLKPLELAHLHLAMNDWLGGFVHGHPYSSHWWEWLYGGGHLFAANGTYGGSYRVVLVAANPVTALAALIAILRFRDRFISLVGLSSLALFPLSGKPVLLIHQFLFVHAFMMAALAIELARLPRRATQLYLLVAAAAFALYFAALTSGRNPVTWPYAFNTIDLTVSKEGRARQSRGKHCLENPTDCF